MSPTQQKFVYAILGFPRAQLFRLIDTGFMRKGLPAFTILLSIALSLSPILPLLSQTPDLTSPTTGLDYTSLKNLLAKGEWRAANDATRTFILKATGRERQGWFAIEDLQKLACWDLATIDRLWKEASNGRFGFSVQYPIFIATGNRPGRLVAIENYQEFGDRVGWRKGNDWIIFKEGLDYSLNAPPGHLPSLRSEYQISGSRLEYTTIAQRLVTCNLVK
jgi:hypothetical protein